MATVNPVITHIGDQDGSTMKFVWTITGTNDGAPMPFAQWADRSAHFVGTWAGGTVVWEGSNDGGVNWFTLTDAQAVAISKTADGLEQIVEVTEYARPRATVSVTSVVVSVVARRQNPMRT
jgi:hypothetical protein